MFRQIPLPLAAPAALAIVAWQLLGSYSSDGVPHLPYMRGPERWAVVAGGSDGLGKAWAEELADADFNLVLIARREPLLLDVARGIRERRPGIQVVTLALDLGKLTEKQVTDQILVPGRDVRVLICNAAYSPIGLFVNNTLEKHMQTVDVNVRSALLLTHHLATKLRRERLSGGIVLMSSMSAVIGTAFVANYAATKAYLTTFAQGLAVELRPHQIDVLACVAGATVTPSYLNAAGEGRSTFIEQLPSDVVSECIAALGRTSSTATGPLNKLVQALFARLLPHRLGMYIMSRSTGVQVGHDPNVLNVPAVAL